MSEPEFSPEMVERCAQALIMPCATAGLTIWPDRYSDLAIAVLRESGYAELVAALQWILSDNAGMSDADYRVHTMQFALDALHKVGAA